MMHKKKERNYHPTLKKSGDKRKYNAQSNKMIT